jgi:hypothetical protein
MRWRNNETMTMAPENHMHMTGIGARRGVTGLAGSNSRRSGITIGGAQARLPGLSTTGGRLNNLADFGEQFVDNGRWQHPHNFEIVDSGLY